MNGTMINFGNIVAGHEKEVSMDDQLPRGDAKGKEMKWCKFRPSHQECYYLANKTYWL